MNKKNWLALLLVFAIAISTFQSCKKSSSTEEEEGEVEWFRSTVFPEDPRNGAASFVLNNQGYVIGGYLKTTDILKDSWAFNGTQWSPKADFTGVARHSGVGFAIGGKGYVGTGFNGTVALNDFYSYDASSNSWSKIADFPGEARFGAVAFSLGGFGYVGLGETISGKTFSDFYKYDPNNNTWTLIPTPFTFKKSYAFSFVIGNKAYVGGGISNQQLPDDFYSFDGTTWVELNDLNRSDSEYTYDVRRYNTTPFAIGNFGYIVSGRTINGVLSNVWKYDPAKDAWTNEHQSLVGVAREKAVGFALGNNGFVTTGVNGTSFLDDNWKFIPVR